MLPLQLPYLKI